MWHQLLDRVRHLLGYRRRRREAAEAAGRAEQAREHQAALLRRRQYESALRQAGVTGRPDWLTSKTGEYPTWPVRRP